MSSTHDIQLAINRIYRVLSSKRKSGFRDIRLGLDRIDRVVPEKQTWKGVHVGGTNGKGSIVAFLSGLFKLAGIGYGSYISPAFPERHNGVMINGLYVNPRMYEMERQHVQEKYDRIASGWERRHAEDPETLSPFELETATAFRVFNKMHVPYGIVEVGMGGATDATNVMKEKAVTIISKIGLDHQEYLGNSITNIARVKAGIMRKGVPCVVDHTNDPRVIQTLRDHARQIGTELTLTWKAEPLLMTLSNDRWKLEGYQIQNLLCAAVAFRHLFPHKEIDFDKLMALQPYLPGRMEKVKIRSEDGGSKRVALVDGAHNMLGIEALVGYVQKHLRKGGQPVTWIMGMSSSKHKPFAKMIEKILRPGDNFAFVEYAPGPNEPPPAPANYGVEQAKTVLGDPSQIYEGEPDIGSALDWAFGKAGEDGPVVITGSLYLIRDLFNLERVTRSREPKTRRPGRSQLYRYTRLAQMRKLTEEESREFKRARRHWRLSPIRHHVFATIPEGSSPSATQVSKQVSELQRLAAFHNEQANAYKKARASVESDIKEKKQQQQSNKEDGNAKTTTKQLHNQLMALNEQVETHRKAYADAMLKLRGYYPSPQKKYMGHRRIVGYPRKPKPPRQSPYIKAAEAGMVEEDVEGESPEQQQQQQQEGLSSTAEEANKDEILQKQQLDPDEVRRLRREMAEQERIAEKERLAKEQDEQKPTGESRP